MKKSYKIINVDCANCAMKMETGIGRLPGVKSARVNFITGKLTIETDLEDVSSILEQAAEVCRKVDKDCMILL